MAVAKYSQQPFLYIYYLITVNQVDRMVQPKSADGKNNAVPENKKAAIKLQLSNLQRTGTISNQYPFGTVVITDSSPLLFFTVLNTHIMYTFKKAAVFQKYGGFLFNLPFQEITCRINK